MLFLVFEVNGDRFALAASEIVEVLPFVHISGLPQAPEGIAGVAVYSGAPVPVIDLTRILGGRPSEPRFDTRMILVNYVDRRGDARLLALLAEHATTTIRRAREEFVASGVSSESARYVGPVATDDDGVVQLVDVPSLLPQPLADALFAEPAGTSRPAAASPA
jgi:chemotaxis-related protein WspB